MIRFIAKGTSTVKWCFLLVSYICYWVDEITWFHCPMATTMCFDNYLMTSIHRLDHVATCKPVNNLLT